MTSADAIGDRLTVRHLALLSLLALVVMFEGFDISTTSVVLPYLARDFNSTPQKLGNALAVIALGSIAAWLLMRLGDRLGRRPVLIIAAAGFSLGSLATVWVDTVAQYTTVQFITRILLVTQIATAYLIVSESFPPAFRGRANGLLGALGSFGAALPFLLISPAIASPLGWRSLFVIGGLPLLTIPFLMLWLRETPVWLEAQSRGAVRLSVTEEFCALASPATRSRFVAMSLLWFLVNFATSVSSLFFTLYVAQERGWTPVDFAKIAPLGLIGCFFGYLFAGFLMDAIGRRWTITIFMTALGCFTQLCYSSNDWWAVAGCFLGLQAALGVWVTAYTLNSELFSTDLRAAANGWCNNLIGRWGAVIAPWLMGIVGASFGGIGPTVVILASVGYLAIPVVWLLIPETRARSLV